MFGFRFSLRCRRNSIVIRYFLSILLFLSLCLIFSIILYFWFFLWWLSLFFSWGSFILWKNLYLFMLLLLLTIFQRPWYYIAWINKITISCLASTRCSWHYWYWSLFIFIFIFKEIEIIWLFVNNHLTLLGSWLFKWNSFLFGLYL